MKELDQKTVQGCEKVREWLKTPAGQKVVGEIADDVLREENAEIKRLRQQVEALPFFKRMIAKASWRVGELIAKLF